MKPFVKLILIAGVAALTGCGKKEQPPETPAAPPQAPSIIQPQVDALHKAEDVNKQSAEYEAEQRKKIDQATQ